MTDESLRVGRYSYARVTAEIEEALQRRKRGAHKAASTALGMSPPAFSKRLNETEGARFSVEELGLLADHLQAPPGWPFVSWKIAADLERAFRTRGIAPEPSAPDDQPAVHEASAKHGTERGSTKKKR
jgi:hypothetical protein